MTLLGFHIADTPCWFVVRTSNVPSSRGGRSLQRLTISVSDVCSSSGERLVTDLAYRSTTTPAFHWLRPFDCLDPNVDSIASHVDCRISSSSFITASVEYDIEADCTRVGVLDNNGPLSHVKAFAKHWCLENTAVVYLPPNVPFCRNVK